MNLNVLRPRQAVESAFEKPSLLLAFILVLLPALASIAGRMLYGVQVKPGNAIYGIVLSYVTFFALALVVFALAWLWKKQATKGKFVAFFCALSLVKVVSLAIVLLSFLTMPLYLSPGAMQAGLQAAGSANSEMATAQISDFIASNPAAVNLPVFYAFLLIAALLTVFGIYLIYLCVKRLGEGKRLASILITVIALIVLGLLPI